MYQRQECIMVLKKKKPSHVYHPHMYKKKFNYIARSKYLIIHINQTVLTIDYGFTMTNQDTIKSLPYDYTSRIDKLSTFSNSRNSFTTLYLEMKEIDLRLHYYC